MAAYTTPPLPWLMQKVHQVQSTLAGVSDTPGLGLSEAAELMQGELGVSLVG